VMKNYSDFVAMKGRKYLTAYVMKDGTICAMGNNKRFEYAVSVVDTHNKYNDHPELGKWYIFEIGRKVYPTKV